MIWSNHFLDALPLDVIEDLRPHIRPVKLVRHQSIVELDRKVETVVLPVDSIISVITVMHDGRDVESRTIGRESGFGLLHSLGARTSFERVIVQSPGTAYVIPVSQLAQTAQRRPALVSCIVGHAQATIVQASHSTACNALHSADARLCRWLAMTQDRLQSDVVPLTQEHLATMLGVQRTTVTALALSLQAQGVIDYKRGNIRILDRPALLRCACECYDNIERATAKILASYPSSADAATVLVAAGS